MGSQTQISPKYVFYWLIQQYEETRQLGSGNNQPAMNKSIVEGILFPIPPVAEQEAIVEIVDDKLLIIDHLEADINPKLMASQGLRQAILRQAFTGRLVPQDPNDEPASELLKRIAGERKARKTMATKRRARNKDSGGAGGCGRPRGTTAEATP